MKLSIVIVNYNVCYYVEQCIVSVLKAIEGMDAEVFVVDNHSQDGSVDYLKQRFSSRIHLIESNHNLGFARANNMAIRQSTGQYVLLLNPDTIVAEDTLRTVLHFMDSHPRAGACGVMMHNATGTRARESRRGMPTPYVALLKMLGFSNRYYMSHLSWEAPAQIEVISGAFCMLRREVLQKVGLLDEHFFMYGEDIDLSYRIVKEGGYENWYVPAPILHYKGESTRKSSFRYVHVFYQAMIIFFRKHYGHLSLFFTIPIKAAIYLRAAMALFQMGWGRMRKSLGFIGKGDCQPEYFFVGSPSMIDECRELARRKGLVASFSTNLDDAFGSDNYTCVVYDTSTYSYAQIIEASYRHFRESMVIGTYSPSTHVLITPHEVIL